MVQVKLICFNFFFFFFRRPKQRYVTLIVIAMYGEPTSGAYVCQEDMKDNVGMVHRLGVSGIVKSLY